MRWTAAALFVIGCAAASTAPPAAGRRDGGLVFETEDLSQPMIGDLGAVDLRTSGLADLAGAPTPDLATPAVCGIKVNEIVTATLHSGTKVATDEFVEIYNSCTTSQKLAGWSLKYRSSSNNGGATKPDITLVADLQKTISPAGYLLWSGAGYTGPSDGALANGLADTGGGVAVIDNNNYIVDSVAYGPVVASHNYLEGSAAPLPPVTAQPGTAIARIPDGADSDDNQADFQLTTKVTPKAANQ
jgi:5'-nucleotidase